MKRFLLLALMLVLCVSLCACGMSPSGIWKKDFYLDSFNQPTEDPYIGTGSRIKGTYNSATVSDGKLEAELRVDSETVRIYLYENGTDKVKNGNNESVYYPVTVKRADGSTFEADGLMMGGSDHVEIFEDKLLSLFSLVEKDEDDHISDALCAKEGEVSFFITRYDQAATNYLFTVKCGNFAELYDAEILEPVFKGYYQSAQNLAEQEKQIQAIELFMLLGDYADSKEKAETLINNLGGPFQIGHAYDTGKSVVQDYTKAMEWYLKASDQGNTDAMNSIGALYEYGHGVEQNYIKASEWYIKAADLGNAAAMTSVGRLYERGHGITQSYTRAMDWYLKASEQGDASAMNCIGMLYEHGHGVDQDKNKALEWYLRASELGDETAKKNYEWLSRLG